jgi:hypothetical protein
MTAPESPRADVELTEAERGALYRANGSRGDLVSTVERILADRLAAVQAEAEIAGQMKHITAEMVRGNQPLEAKEEMIADLRARLSHVEAERDGWQARAATNREGWAQMLARAESAEAERDDLRARLLAVETLVEGDLGTRDEEGRDGEPGSWARGARHVRVAVRAVLASPSTRGDSCQCAAVNAISDPRLPSVSCPKCSDDDASPSTHTQQDTETAAQAAEEREMGAMERETLRRINAAGAQALREAAISLRGSAVHEFDARGPHDPRGAAIWDAACSLDARADSLATGEGS